MICPRCGARIAPSSKFCGDCGSPLPWQCPSCGSENPPGKRFCGECGAGATVAQTDGPEAVAPASATPAVERRQLTIMFADMVGSTALGSRLDPEDLREVIAAFHGCITGLAARFGGFVARYMGDGALLYFGYPQANEDDAERTIRAGLSIVKAVGSLNTIAGPPGTLSVRVGIATGTTVVGDLIGFASSLESSVVGDTANLAARLQTVADPGMVVIDDATHRLTGGLFDYRDLGPANLKGRSTAVAAWAVLGESAVESRFEALRSMQSVLVGREEEIALLERRWNQAKTGEGRVVLLSGEPGVGKSRLVAALRQKLANVPKVYLRFLCSPHHQDTPLHPIIRHLERAAGFRQDDAAAEKRDKLRRLLATTSSSDVEIALFADLLSIPGPPDDLPTAMTPRDRKEMTFASILRHFGSLAKQTPVFAEFEDIHWADPSSRELLDVLVEAIERLPILLIITARPEVKPSWATRHQVTVQLLGSLYRRDAVSLIRRVAGDDNLPEDVIERIVLHADGVPLFIEELTKTVVESGVSESDSGHLVTTHPLSPDVVPASLQASMMARLDRLTGGKEIAQIGSVIGRDFSFAMLLTLSELPAKQLEGALAQLVQTGLAIARGQPPDSTYSFKHALLQDAAYASLLRGRRRALHLRVAEALMQNTVDSTATEPELVAWHFGEGGAADKSIDLYLKAAERATGRFALGEMVSHLTKALRQVEYLDESPRKLRCELDLQVALGHALIDYRGSGSEEVRAAFERARELCLALGTTKQLVVVFDGLVLNHHFTHSETAKMLDYAAELFEIGERTGDQLALLWARRSRSSANLLQGRFEEARDEMRLVIDMYKSSQNEIDTRRMARDPRVSTYTLLGIALTALGYPTLGSAVSLEGLRHAETLNHVPSLNTGLRRVCLQRMMLRDALHVLELSDRLVKLNTEHQTFVGSHEGIIFRGWAQLCDRLEPAVVERVRTSLEQLDAAKSWVMLPFFMTSVAEVIGNHGDRRGAIAILDRAAELTALTGEQWCAAELIRLKVRFGVHDHQEAAAELELSLAKAREQRAKWWELRSATSLAELLRAGGDLIAARDLVAPVYAWFTEGFDSPDLVAARVLLDGLRQQDPVHSRVN